MLNEKEFTKSPKELPKMEVISNSCDVKDYRLYYKSVKIKSGELKTGDSEQLDGSRGERDREGRRVGEGEWTERDYECDEPHHVSWKGSRRTT